MYTYVTHFNLKLFIILVHVQVFTHFEVSVSWFFIAFQNTEEKKFQNCDPRNLHKSSIDYKTKNIGEILFLPYMFKVKNDHCNSLNFSKYWITRNSPKEWGYVGAQGRQLPKVNNQAFWEQPCHWHRSLWFAWDEWFTGKQSTGTLWVLKEFKTHGWQINLARHGVPCTPMRKTP